LQYRTIPHGGEKISIIGLGMGSIHESRNGKIVDILEQALEAGVNYFDLCPSNARPFKPYANVLSACRDDIFLQMHFGACYDSGKYALTRELDSVKRTFEGQLIMLGTDYTDMGYVHCIDEETDFERVMDSGLWKYMRSLKDQGAIRHLGFSSHEPRVARRFIETGLVDMCMFSINPAYDFPTESDSGTVNEERMALYRLCEKENVGIAVMKAYGGGQLLDRKRSPFKTAFTPTQLISYALDRPAVLTCLPGIRNSKDLESALAYLDASDEERDYAQIGSMLGSDMQGVCVYCDHCQPCPAGIDIALVNKYYDLALTGDKLARSHYHALSANASDCRQCGHCDEVCPFHVNQQERMRKIAKYFKDTKSRPPRHPGV